ncbi:MAG: hypothetical protein U0838_16785 [Chloroflexota bacterium]
MRRLIWTAYFVMAGEGFLVYAVGFITPYVQDSLHVAPWLAQTPNSLMAIGLGLGGAVARPLNARFSPQATIRAWLLGFALSGLLLAAPVHILVTMAGGFVYGTSLGAWLVHVNSSLGQGEGGAMLLTRANLWSVSGGLVGPIVLSSGGASTIGWWYGSLLPVPLFLVLAFITQARPRTTSPPAPAPGPPPLPQFWLTWLFLTLCIGASSRTSCGARRWSRAEPACRWRLSPVWPRPSRSAWWASAWPSFIHVGRPRQVIVLQAGTACITALGTLLIWAAWRPSSRRSACSSAASECRRSTRMRPASRSRMRRLRPSRRAPAGDRRARRSWWRR